LTTWARADGCAGTNYPFLTQKERDIETGLDYFEARYYSSTQGRFTSVDPLLESAEREIPQSWNRYTYVLNNPLLYTDPTGEIWVRSVGGDIVWFSQERWDNEISKAKDANGNALYTPLSPSEMEFNTNFGRVRLNLNGPDPNATQFSDAYYGFSIVGDNKTDYSVALAAGIAIGAKGRNPILMLGGATIATLWILSNPINQGLPLVDPNVYTQGQRDERKANPDRVEVARRLAEQLRDELAKLQSKPNKTPDDKKLVDKIKAAIRKQVERMKKSETHGRKGKGS
jgi:RHS repeat-associated protein